MSIKTYTRVVCDMCGGEYDPGDREMANSATFSRACWETRGGDNLDLCNRCADKVQRFIAGGGGEPAENGDLR